MSDRVAARHVVFGAAGGIGSALCRRLVAQGDQVLLAGRTDSKVAELGQTLDMPHVAVDACNLEAVEACLDAAAKASNQPISGVVNCVGSLLLKPAHLTTEADWHEAISLNLTSAFAVVRAAAKVMRRQGGSVVLMASAAARIGLSNHEAIAAAKAGVIGLAISAAASYGSKGLRFNAVAPGMVKTPLTERLWSNPSSAKSSLAYHALNRLGEPEDVASMIAWLLDPEQSWVTGQVFGVDGGLAGVKPPPR